MTKPAIQAVIDKVLADNKGKRVVSFNFEGQTYWLKQPERLTGAMRWLKSQPLQSFQLEISALQSLAAKGAPVPELVSFGDDYFVVADAGMPVNGLLADSDDPQQKLQILKDSAKGLAQLHQAGFAHGRPALRDICWQDGKITFIDFEANQQDKNMARQQVRDLLVYIHSLYRYLGADHQLIDPALAYYRQCGGETCWRYAQKRLSPWQWLGQLLWPFRYKGGKDLKPMYWVLKAFRRR
ncbi:phosphotransferase [Shewanella algidipiscicola]|uniref:Serine/threonine protein kinase n=1 Tax=Shewanella algidipiscicola TaxID=614070 RepID=A0ABQ4PGK6_9GAMM|nr:phosphotransferase [Shewanella algidipiscicola]GIU46636.1 hypothetical protein TUM4630_17630 [Shewanella algidipiscicola]